MKDALADQSKDWLTLLLAGLGFSLNPHEWLGGMFLALAGASLARHWQPERDRQELWAVMLAAFLVSHAAALAVQAWHFAWPIQIVMLGAGFASRYATRFALRMIGRIETRTDTIADRVIDRVLPRNPDQKDAEP